MLRTRTLIACAAMIGLLATACAGSGGATTTVFQGFEGCRAGAGSAIVFLQRTLDQAGLAEPGEMASLLPGFDDDVRAMMLRAQEVHCTEDGFNVAVIARVDELTSSGPGGDALIVVVRRRGLGSLDENAGGLIRLPGS